MTLIAEAGVITSPGATGNQTTNLGAAFNGVLPKVLFLLMTYDTADGAVGADGILTRGIGTFNGGSAQNIVQHWFDDDGTTAQQCVNYHGTDAILKGVIADGTTQDFACTLSSLNSGTPSNFVLNWSDLPGTGSIRIHYLVLGGTDISAARVGSFTMSTAAATQDVTVVASFGQPDVLLFQASPWTAAGAFNATDGRIMFGAAKDDTERRCTLFGAEDGSANMSLASWQKSRAGLGFTATTGTADFEFDLSAKGSWPTDGFQVSYSDQASFAFGMGYLAIKGTLACTIGSTTVPIAGSPPVAQNLTLSGGTPKAAIFWGTSIPANASIDNNHADLGSYFQGWTDGTNEGVAGVCNDDANGTSIAGRFFSATKAIRHYTNSGTPALQSECDSSFSGSDVVLSWNDIDATAREFNYIIFGEASSGTTQFGASATSLSMGFASAGVRAPRGVSALPLTLGYTTSAKRTATGASTYPLNITFTTFIPAPATQFGASTFPLTVSYTSQGKRTTKSSSTFPLSISHTTQGKRTAFSSSTFPLTVSYTTQAKRTVHGASTYPLTIAYSSRYASPTGRSALPLVIGFTTSGKVTRHGQSLFPLTLGVSSSAHASHFVSSSFPLAFSYAASGSRTAKAASTLPLVFSVSSSWRAAQIPGDISVGDASTAAVAASDAGTDAAAVVDSRTDSSLIANNDVAVVTISET